MFTHLTALLVYALNSTPSPAPQAAEPDLFDECYLEDSRELDIASRVIAGCTAVIMWPGAADEIEVLADAYRLRGVAFRDWGELTLSEQDIRKAISLVPDQAASHRMLAATLYTQDRWNEAEVSIQKSLEFEEHWQGYLTSCYVRMNLDKFDLAQADCAKSIELGFEDEEVYYFRAYSLTEAGRPEEALDVVEEAIALFGSTEALMDAKRQAQDMIK